MTGHVLGMTEPQRYVFVLTRTVTTTVYETVRVAAATADEATLLAGSGAGVTETDDLGANVSNWDVTTICPACGTTTRLASDGVRECNSGRCCWNETDDWVEASPSLIGGAA